VPVDGVDADATLAEGHELDADRAARIPAQHVTAMGKSESGSE
jgi:hypothetical protein